ncbi:MAG TPA: tetratricopeptide repeat protein [Planctomycetaceae bacterium]|nr:tetratricopeptide repeat protein [Planctomycetaceae bacterium]
MHLRNVRDRWVLWAAAAVVGTVGLGPGRASSSADDRRAAAQADEQPTEAPRPEARESRLQPGDDVTRPLESARPRTAVDQNRVDALSWFMTGQLRERRNDFKGALDAYREAVKLDPNSVGIYRELVPLAFSLNQTDDAVKYALKAVELDPQDYELLRRLGVHMATQSRLPEAVQLLEKAGESKSLDKHSAVYVALMRDLGILYSAIGNIEKAADAYEVVFEARQSPKKYGLDSDARTRAALEQDPTSSYERIGQAFLDADRIDKAIRAFELAARDHEGRPGTLNYNLARVYLQTKQPQKALDELQKYFDAELQSKGREAYELLGQILAALEESDELLPRLEKLAEKDARNGTLQYFLAEQYLKAGRLEDSERLYKKTLESVGGPEGHIGLAAVYRRMRRPAELLNELSDSIDPQSGRRMRASDPRETLQRLERIETELEAIGQDEELAGELLAEGRKRTAADGGRNLNFAGAVILGKLAANANKTEDAVHFYRFALERRPGAAVVVYQELSAHLSAVDDYAGAAKVLREAVENPAAQTAKPEFLYRLSLVEGLAGNTDGALEAIREAQRLLPDVALLQFQEAWVYYRAEQWDEAIDRLETVIQRFPEEREIVRRCQFTLSNVYVQQGEMRKGEEILERILADEPDDPSVNNDLGYLYADQGKNLEQAESMIRKAVTAEPENAAYLDSMGWVLYKLGKFEEAVEWLEKAVKLPSGSDGTIWDHLGDGYDRLGQREKAVEAWRKALEEAKSEPRPDTKLIGRIEDKLKNAADGAGELQPEKPGAP